MDTPFPADPVLTGITLAYTNRALIADQVLPRTDPIGSPLFKYRQWALEEGFTIPNTRVGRRGAPGEIEFTGTEVEATCEDYGLDDPIPQLDIDVGAQSNVDPVGRGVEGLTDLILLDREKRVADVVFAQATYPAAQRVALAGVNRWNDFAGSDPIDDIMTGLDTPILRPNTAVFGRETFTKLIQHPAINKAVNGTAGDTGVVRRAQIAELFELDDVLVGQSFLNTSKKGQTAAFARVWGKHAALLHINPQATGPQANQVTFGWTAQYGMRMAGSQPDPKISVRGGQRARVWESVKEVIVAAQTGYFIETAVD